MNLNHNILNDKVHLNIKQLFTREYMWATHVWNLFDFGVPSSGEPFWLPAG
ncbi:MAG: hypothetical protein IJ443_00690 [Firmicutes bacterium]|nr:hypothetical protein [Bacillota bacterium]